MESRHKKRHTAAAKAALAERVYGTAEAVPLRKTLAATHGTQPAPEKSRRFARDAILRYTAKSNADGTRPSRFHAAMNEATARINAQRWQSGVESPALQKIAQRAKAKSRKFAKGAILRYQGSAAELRERQLFATLSNECPSARIHSREFAGTTRVSASGMTRNSTGRALAASPSTCE